METTINIEKQIKSALQEDNAELLKQFLESSDHKDLVVNYRDPKSRKTLLSLAAEQGRLETVRLLLTICHVDETWRNNQTALMLASKSNQLAIVKLLLEKGAKVNAIDAPGGLSALSFACRNGHEEIVKLLYRHGASIFNEEQNSVKIAIETLEKVFAAAADKRNVMHAIVDNEKNKGQINREVFFAAIECNNVEFVELMLDRGMSVETPHSIPWNKPTPLILAVKKEQPAIEMVKLLLDRGADFTTMDRAHYTAVHYAAHDDKIKIMQLLLERGADINVTGFSNRTPLRLAVREEQEQATKYLLSMGADVNIEDDLGWAIHFLLRHRAVMWCGNSSPVDKVKSLKISKIVVKHIVKMQSEGLFVCESNLREIRNDVALNAYQSDCKREMDEIKAKKFDGLNFSLYDVFKARDALQLAAYAKNSEVADYLKSGKFREGFPVYSETILENFDRGATRNYLQTRVCNFFTNLFTRKEDKLPKLPVICVSKMFSYLSNKDLINLRAAYY